MRVGVLGINHKSADLLCREAIARACRKLTGDLPIANQYACIVVSTCHRSEVYFSAEDLAQAHIDLIHWFRQEIGTPFEHKMYAYFGVDSFLHLAKVTSGLDSVLIGESEIQRQIKESYEQSTLNYQLPSAMHFLFQKALRIGKLARTFFLPQPMQATLPATIFEVCEHFFSDLAAQELLFVGNSEINRKVILHLKRKGIAQMSLCTRSQFSASEFTAKERIRLLDWGHLSHWSDYPLVIAGSKTASFLLTPDQSVDPKTRLILDLGMPRNVDPRLGKHPQVHVMNMDDLGMLMEKRQQKDLSAVALAESFIEQKVHQYLCKRGALQCA